MKNKFDKTVELDEADARVFIGDFGMGFTLSSEYEGEITINLDVETTTKLIDALTEARDIFAG